MFLFIDTSQRDKLIIALVNSTRSLVSLRSKVKSEIGVLDRIILKINQNHSKKLLPSIEEILKRNDCPLDHLRGIGVVRGPGSFTGIRVGVACANALGFALNIPVKGIKYQGKDLIKLLFRELKGSEFSQPAVPFYKHKPV